MKVNAMMVALTAILTSLAMVGCTQPIWLTIIIAIPAVIVSMKIAIAIQTASEQETTKEKRDAMSIYWYRRIVAIIVIILAIIGAIKVVSYVEEYLSEDFECLQSIQVRVVEGDTTSGIASKQVQSGNCKGYESLTHNLVETYGTELQPGDIIQIPLHG